MNAKELREMTVEQLNEKLAELTAEKSKLGIQNKLGQLTDTSSINKARRDIARIKTVLTQKAGK